MRRGRPQQSRKFGGHIIPGELPMRVQCPHDAIDADIEIGPACSTIRFEPGMRYPEDPPGEPLRFISISRLRCTACHKRLTRQDVGARFEPGGDLHHPRFIVSYAKEPSPEDDRPLLEPEEVDALFIKLNRLPRDRF